MATLGWPTKRYSVASLHLDAKNPRLGLETALGAPREIIQYLFEHDKTIDIADSIATRGFFPNEALLAIKEGGRTVVVEGNRRLAALKALREPGLLEGAHERKVARLSRRITDLQSIAEVPVTVAPHRRATDRQLAGRHIGTPVRAWTAENRASFILEKLEEGYENDELRDELGFTLADIQKARQTRAIAEMARSLDLPEEVSAKLENPRARIFTTIERVFDSPVGRDFFKVERDPEHGLRGQTTKGEFIRGFTKFVIEVALGNVDSRMLNKQTDIEKYFEEWDAKDRPQKKRGSFFPSDIIQGKSVASPSRKSETKTAPKKSQQISKTVLPRDFKIRHGNERLIDIRSELIKIKREECPNAGAVLLRVFFELAVMNYLERTGRLQEIIKKLGRKGKLPHGTPKMGQLVPEITRIAKKHLSASEAKSVEKAIRYDAAAPFTLSDLNAFVHQASDPPGAREIWQFWIRTEPLFRLMLEQDPEATE